MIKTLFEGVARDQFGNAKPSATVLVTDSITGTNATLYDPDTPASSLTNPVTADSDGNFRFRVLGEMRIRLDITYQGTTTVVNPIVSQQGGGEPVAVIDLSSVTKYALTHDKNYRLEFRDLQISTTDSIELKFSTDGTTPVVTGYVSRTRYTASDTTVTEETLTDAMHFLGSETAGKGPLADTSAQATAYVYGCVSGNWTPQVEATARYMDEGSSSTRMDTVADVAAADYTHVHVVPNAGTMSGYMIVYEE